MRFKTLVGALGKALRRPSWLPVPGFAVKAAVGELSEYPLHGRRAVPAALTARGFEVRYPTLEPALRTSWAADARRTRRARRAPLAMASRPARLLAATGAEAAK